MLKAWGFASAFGPLLIAHLHQASGNYRSGLHDIAVVMLISAVLPFLVRPPRPGSRERQLNSAARAAQF